MVLLHLSLTAVFWSRVLCGFGGEIRVSSEYVFEALFSFLPETLLSTTCYFLGDSAISNWSCYPFLLIFAVVKVLWLVLVYIVTSVGFFYCLVDAVNVVLGNINLPIHIFISSIY